jgi:hypothetical protein
MLDSGLSKEQMLRAQHRIAQQIVFEVAARKVVLVGAVTVYRQAEARCIRDAAAAEQHAAADAAAFAAADACWECRHDQQTRCSGGNHQAHYSQLVSIMANELLRLSRVKLSIISLGFCIICISDACTSCLPFIPVLTRLPT